MDEVAATAGAAVRVADLLGLPADARLLIVNCDDFGMYHAINAAVMESIQHGIAMSCSLMVPCPWARHAMHLLREHPEISFGIHLTLFCDTTHYGWSSLTPKERVPSLLTEQGGMFTPEQVPELLARARPDEVEREFRAQIRTVLDAGLAPTHLDWRCLHDGGRGDILDLTVALAREYGLAVRVTGDPGREQLHRRGLPVIDHELMDSFNLDLEDKPNRYAQLLRDLPAGLTQWAVHPGLGDQEAQAIDPGGWLVRRTDYEFLTSPTAGELLRQEGITVLDYRPLQQAWSRTAA
jgi:chitin disaccharide deacetylase